MNADAHARRMRRIRRSGALRRIAESTGRLWRLTPAEQAGVLALCLVAIGRLLVRMIA